MAPNTLPLCCSPRAYELLRRQLPSINSPDALLHGAVAVAMHQMEDVDPGAVDAQLQRYASRAYGGFRATAKTTILGCGGGI